MRTWLGFGSSNGFSVSSSLPGLTACTARYVDPACTIVTSADFCVSQLTRSGLEEATDSDTRGRSAVRVQFVRRNSRRDHRRAVRLLRPLPEQHLPRGISCLEKYSDQP